MDALTEAYSTYQHVIDPVLGAAVFLGLYQILSWGLSFLKFVHKYFLRGSKNFKKLGSWAVVTGGSDGIGLGYATQLAKKGMNVLLIARNEEKLKACCEEILEKAKGVEVEYFVCDYMKLREVKSKLEARLNGLKQDGGIGVLINNVGVSYPFAQYFHELDEARSDAMIKLNIEATIDMTRMVLQGDDGMVSRGKGAVVAIGSAAGYMPVGDPLYAVYSGSKAYADFFSRSLAVEYAKKGITFECHVPYLVPSKLSKVRGGFFIPSVSNFAKAAMRCIGQGEKTVLVHWRHALQDFLFLSVMPRSLFMHFFMKQHFHIRKRGFAKLALKNKEE